MEPADGSVEVDLAVLRTKRPPGYFLVGIDAPIRAAAITHAGLMQFLAALPETEGGVVLDPQQMDGLILGDKTMGQHVTLDELAMGFRALMATRIHTLGPDGARTDPFLQAAEPDPLTGRLQVAASLPLYALTLHQDLHTLLERFCKDGQPLLIPMPEEVVDVST